jgi:Bacterial pre-peptidase C-terminal domain
MCFPLGVVPGVETKITLRGQRLDTATEVRFGEVKATVKIISKGKANVPNMQDAAKVGDTQIETLVTLPADFAGNEAAFTVVTPAGESAPHKLLVDKTPTIAEKEPNNGFRQAQPVQVPQLIDGAIGESQDVDVFRFDGQAGQQLVIEVLAARYGSSLDSFLTLYNADGQIIASNDDSGDSSDSRLEATLPKAGVYYVGILDAQDTGGPAHVYRLVIRAK